MDEPRIIDAQNKKGRAPDGAVVLDRLHADRPLMRRTAVAPLCRGALMVRVAAISLNPGDVTRRSSAEVHSDPSALELYA